jgi:hypothetical protein
MRTAKYWAALTAMFGLMAGGAVLADEVGPHKGPVAVWGDEEYHLEVVPNKTDGSVVVYVFGDHEALHDKKRKPLAKDTKLTLTLKTSPATTLKLEASPEKDDPAGQCSKFTAKHDVFKKDMKLAGTISGKVGTKPYTGDFKQK